MSSNGKSVKVHLSNSTIGAGLTITKREDENY